MHAEITNANTPHQSLLHSLIHSPPSAQPPFRPTIRRMHKQQIDISQLPHLPNRVLDRPPSPFIRLPPRHDLGREEDVLARNARCKDRLCTRSFILVERGAVDVPVSAMYSFLHYRAGGLGRGLEDLRGIDG